MGNSHKPSQPEFSKKGNDSEINRGVAIGGYGGDIDPPAWILTPPLGVISLEELNI